MHREAASAAAVLLAAGTPGKRRALGHARVVLHQPHGSMQGPFPAEDIKIHASEMVRQRRLMEEILARHTGQPVAKVHQDLDRDFILMPEDAKAYGVIDHVGGRSLPR